MSTTIDSLVIDIQSSSTNAVASIESLAGSLEKMKKSTISSTAIKNLQGLTKALKELTPVSSNASKLGAMAEALNKLTAVGSLNGLINQLSKLPSAMRSLSGVNFDGMDSKFERLASAANKLSGVKAGGLPSMVNALAKIGDVTASLDDKAIDDFAERVEKLTSKLEPLSKQMTSVKVGLSGINGAARKAGTGVSEFGKTVKSVKLSSFIFQLQQMYQAYSWAVTMLSNFMSDAIEWEGISARFGRGFGAQAQQTYEWIQELNKEMGINVQQFMQYSSIYATMLTGFGVAQKDASTMALGYAELTYDIWAGYNDIYKNYADAADAVRSAIAGEVEPIRRAGFTIVESTLEQTAKNHGLTISLEKATEAQKSYLRYLTLVDQAHSQSLVGTYAKEMDTAEGVMRTFNQQLRSLQQAFGSLFLPILVEIMPWLQAFVDLLTEAVHWVAALFGVKIQKIDPDSWGASSLDGLGDSANTATDAVGETTKALKELKNATLGIDELNVISPPDKSGGSGGSAGAGGSGFSGLEVESLWDRKIFDDIKSQVDDIKKKLEEWLPTVGLVAAALAGLRIAKLLTDIDDVAVKMKGLSKGLSVASIAIAVGALVWDFTGAYLDDGNWASFFSALGTTAIGTGLAYKFGGKGGAGFTLMVSGVAMLGRLVFDISEGTVDFGDPQTWVTLATGGIETLLGSILTWKVIGPTIKTAISQFIYGTSWSSIGTTITTALSSSWSSIVAALSAIPVWGWIAAAIVAFVASAISLAVVDHDFTDVGEKVGKVVGNIFAYSPVGLVVKIGKWLYDAVVGAINWFNENVDLGKIATDFLFGLAEFISDPMAWWNDFVEAGKNIIAGIGEGIKQGWNNLIGNIGEFFTGFWTGFCKAFGIASPAKKMEPGGKYIVEGVWSGITGSFAWIVGKVTQWATDLISKITGAMKPSAISEKLSTMWTNAKNWWNNSKSALSAYTPSIGNIKDKLSSAWTTAKTWWTNSKGALSYTPTIGSILDKLKSAWNTAKDWWSKNVKLSIPSLSFKISYSKPSGTLQKAVVNALGLDGWPKLSFAANGGIFDTGSLIWAGESGAEIVANAGGGKTGVMNVQQMSEAVYEGVYSAVVAAMRATNGGGNAQAVNVYLDGKQITSTVEQRQKERGANLMGNQVYAY